MSTNIEGMLRHYKGKKITFMEDDNGKPLTDKQARAEIARLQALGHKLIPSGNCEGFDPFGGGCPGHPVEEPSVIIASPGEVRQQQSGRCYQSLLKTRNMKALSILQPWASLVVTTDQNTGKAYKQIETRSWNTKYRGPLLIHASIGKQYRKLPTDGPLWMNCPLRIIESMPFGAIIGMVNLVDTMNTERIILPPNETKYRSIISDPWKISDQELAFGDYSHGRYGWLLSDPIMFKNPIPCKGSLSIWNLPGELEEAVQEQIRMATAPSVLLATPGDGAVIVEGVKSSR